MLFLDNGNVTSAKPSISLSIDEFLMRISIDEFLMRIFKTQKYAARVAQIVLYLFPAMIFTGNYSVDEWNYLSYADKSNNISRLPTASVAQLG